MTSALGCKRDLGDCNLDGQTPDGVAIDGPAAFDIAYRLTDGLPMYEGQALVQSTCGDGAFCHSPAAVGAGRIGVPAQLDFDVGLACNEAADAACASPPSCEAGQTDTPYCERLHRLHGNQAKVREWAEGMIQEIRAGAMPPGEEGRRVENPTPWLRKADDSLLPSIHTKDGQEIVRNWLACQAPVVARTELPPPPQCTIAPTPETLCDLANNQCNNAAGTGSGNDCSSDADCPMGENCFNTDCMPFGSGCNNAAGTGSGNDCSSDADCPISENCRVNFCERKELTPCTPVDDEICIYTGPQGELPDPMWSEIYWSIMFTTCVGCHGPSNDNVDQNPNNPLGGVIPGGASAPGLEALNLTGSDTTDTTNWASESWSAVVNVSAYTGGLCASQGTLVIPNDSQNSLMIEKMRDTQVCGTVMPPTGGIAGSLIQVVEDWIDMGAQNN